LPDPGSLDSTYVDPPLGRPVTSRELEERGRNTDWNEFFKNRISLKNWFPVRPYLSADNYVAALERYYTDRTRAWCRIADYTDCCSWVAAGQSWIWSTTRACMT